MRLKRCRCILLIALAASLLFGVCGLLYFRADWCFRTWNTLRPYPSFEPRTASLSTKTVTAEALSASGTSVEHLLFLVNEDHPLPNGFLPVLEELNGARMHPQMIPAYVALRDSLQAKTGERIYVSSDFRTAEEQAEIFASSPDGIAAQVGCSEHEAGLALDVYVKGYGGMSILKTEAGRELARQCADYGFIIRYPEGKEEITHTSYEPWHIRYVGAPHARVITEHGLVYEEYISALTPGTWYEIEDFYVGRFPTDAVEIPSDPVLSFTVSYDNTGHCIVTVSPR